MNFHELNGKEESLLELSNDLQEYLYNKLTDVYKNYFPFDQPDRLERYFTAEGASVEKDENGNPRLKVKIRSNPLRIVLNDPSSEFQRVAWQLNG